MDGVLGGGHHVEPGADVDHGRRLADPALDDEGVDRGAVGQERGRPHHDRRLGPRRRRLGSWAITDTDGPSASMLISDS